MFDGDVRQAFWETACALQRPMLLGVAILSAMLALALFSLLFVDRDSAAYVVLQVDFVLLIAGLSALLFVLYRCMRR